MTENRLNEEISEIAHAASLALISDDRQTKIELLTKVYDAIASILPVDQRTVTTVAEPASRHPTAKCKFINAHDCYAIGMSIPGHNLGVIIEEVDRIIHRYEAEVYEGEEVLFTIQTTTRGKNFLAKVTRGAMKGALSYLGKNARRKSNNKEVK